jgi:hypothetical protein
MKVRFTVACEKCKAPVPVGTQAVRLYGRIWHIACAEAWKHRNETTAA